MSATIWCPGCQRHEVDPANHRPLCPVCLDRQAKDAEAKITALGWTIWGTA